MAGKDGADGSGRAVLVIDFEGSCLPGTGQSYPIEVALGDVATGVIRSWLIRPEPEWSSWTWDPAAERVHGISQDYLAREGIARAIVANEVREMMKGRAVVSDHPLYDQIWLGRLTHGAPGVRLESLHELCLQISRGGKEGIELIERAQTLANDLAPIRHRAAADVAHHIAVLRYLIERSGAS